MTNTGGKGDSVRVPLEIRSDAFLDTLRNRLVVSLDMNLWIDLAEGTKAHHQDARDWLGGAVAEGLAFFPLTASLIWELYRQSPDSALRVAEMMDKLSLGGCFAPLEVVRRREVLRYVAAVVQGDDPEPLAGEHLFVPVGSYLASNPSLSFPPGWSGPEMERCASGVEGGLRRLTLCDLVWMRSTELPHDPRPPPAYQETRVGRAEFAKGSPERARRVEEECIARESVLPLIADLPVTVRAAFLKRARSSPKDRYGGLMGELQRSARALRAEVDTYLETGRNHDRKDRIQDFFDIEFLIVPRAYSDVLASRDRQIRDLMEGRLRRGDGPMFAGSLPELRETLELAILNRAAGKGRVEEESTASRGPEE